MEGKILELVEAIRRLSSKNTVSVNVFVNCEEHIIQINKRTADQLKSAGISMRNLKGDFI